MADMTTSTTPETAFAIRCPYCGDVHRASLDIAPYGGTDAYGHLIYGVECDMHTIAALPPIVRYGVTAHSDHRI